MAWPNLKEKLALVPTEPGTSSMALLHVYLVKVHLSPSILNHSNHKLVIKINFFEWWWEQLYDLWQIKPNNFSRPPSLFSTWISKFSKKKKKGLKKGKKLKALENVGLDLHWAHTVVYSIWANFQVESLDLLLNGDWIIMDQGVALIMLDFDTRPHFFSGGRA